MIEFSADDSIGSLPPEQVVAYLREIGDHAEADQILAGGVGGQSFSLWPEKAYVGTDAIIGFIEHGSDRIVPASAVQADEDLRGRKLKISFDRFRVEKYPGVGEHRVLCGFTGKNQQDGEAEELSFAVTCNVRDGQASAVLALPIFVGIVAGPNGISFQGKLVNVRSSLDYAILSVLDSDVFKQGLELIDKVQPAIKPLTTLAQGVVKMAAGRSGNKQVHHFMLGLAFTGSPTSTRLRRGSYVVVQIGRIANWDWSNYRWDAHSSRIAAVSEHVAAPNWSYAVFGLSLDEVTS